VLALLDARTQIANGQRSYYDALKECRLAREELAEVDLLATTGKKPATQAEPLPRFQEGSVT